MQVFRTWPILACVPFLAVGISQAQEESEKTKQRISHVAFIDMEKLLKDHAGLQKKLKKLNDEQADFDNKVKPQRQTIKSLEEELALYRAGTPDHIELKEHLFKVRTKLEIRIAVQNDRFARASAAAHYDAYKDIILRVSRFAESNNVGAVINYDSSAVDANDPDSVMKALKRRVVFQRKLDITTLITQSCNQAQRAQEEDEVPFR